MTKTKSNRDTLIYKRGLTADTIILGALAYNTDSSVQHGKCFVWCHGIYKPKLVLLFTSTDTVSEETEWIFKSF